jgi:uncharacterized membrane protein YoaK (UPF0700 family)
LLAALTVLTVVSGINDAVTYLGLGHVFTANMTGNVVVLGFAAAAAPGFSVPASLTSIACFLVGAVAAGRMARHTPSRRTLFLRSVAIEMAATTATAVVAALAVSVGTGWARYTVIAILGFAMGVRNSTVRRLAVPDVTTTVLTMTMTGLAADSPLAGGVDPHRGRRLAAVASMVTGAFVGALLLRHVGAAWPLGLSASMVLVTGALYARHSVEEEARPE